LKFDPHTAFLMIGALYLIAPLMTWMALSNQRTRSVRFWSVGGLLFGLGAMGIGLRDQMPPVLGYTAVAVVLWLGCAMKIVSLRDELKRPARWTELLLLLVLAAFVFETFRSQVPQEVIRFSVGIGMVIGLFGWLAWLSFELFRTERLQSMLWLALVYGLATLLNLVRLVFVITGLAEPEATSSDMHNILTIVSGMCLALVANFAFLAAYLERASRDLTWRLGQQVSLLERQRSIGLMASSFAHELTQPLTAIQLDVDLLTMRNAQQTLSNNDWRDALRTIETNLARTLALIDRIRNFVRPQAQQRVTLDVVQLVHEVADLLTHDFRRQQVSLQVIHPNHPMLAACDKVEISQILLNLLRNAVQAMMALPHKPLTVTVQGQTDAVHIQVRDQGTGFSTEHLNEIGQSFFTTKQDGMGMGLSISRAIAEKHNGRLLFENAPGGGAQVTLTLPTRLAI
jgi:signal transduction histidine kinase